ncbi:uncharacterized protein [Cardiocondyla obscurior]|uniref:uncharacterized protein isoform X2 n=1 Tax=Cardiocondyla obscurior TaxID=286306 RepID=UPI00396569DB
MATYEMINDFAEVIEARCNLDCHCVSITVVMVWDIESDQIHEMDFGESDDIADDDSKLAAQCKGRLITAHCWDVEEPRLLVCRAQRLESHNSISFIKENDQVISTNTNLFIVTF